MSVRRPAGPPLRGPRPRLALARLLAARRRFVDHEVEVAGVRARSRCGGPADADVTVVLLPGLGLAGRYMLPLAAELATSCRVWIPVIPGFGRSARPAAPLDVPAMGAFVAAWAGAVGIGPAAVVGNSMGSQVAVEAARHDPARWTHLVLDAPTVDAGARSAARLLAAVAVDATREPPSLGLVQVSEWAATGPRRLARTASSVLDHALERRVGSVACPVLVVRSGRDPFVSARWAQQLSAAAPDGALHVVERGTHALPYSGPAVLAAVVREFVGAP